MMDGMAGSSTGAEWWRPAAAVGSAKAETAAAPAKDSVIAFATLLLFLVLLLLAPQAFVPGIGRVRIALFTGVFAIVAHCWARFAAGRPLMRWTREMWLAGALLGWAIATLPLSVWPGGTVRVLLDDYLKALAIFWLLSNTITTLQRLRMTAWTLSLTAAPMAGVGVWNFLSHNAEYSGRIAGYHAPFVATIVANPNGLALVVNLILPLTIALFLVSRRPMERGLLAALIALDVSAIVVTFSRGGFLALATIFALYLRTLYRRRERTWATAVLFLVLVTVPLLPSGYLDRLGTITNIHADSTGSAQERWEDIGTGLVYALTHPLIGGGLGMNAITLCMIHTGHQASDCARVCFSDPPPYPPCLYLHNMYLAYAMDLGWLGIGLFILLLVSSIKSVALVRDRCTGLSALRDLSVLAEGVRIMLVALAVAALFYPNAYEVYAYFPAAFAVAAVAVYEAEARTAATTAAPASRCG